MKTSLHILGILWILGIIQACSFNTVKGNGQVVTKEVSISDYQTIEFSGGASLVYEQNKDAKPYLRIEIDDNIFPLLDINTKNGILSIRNKENIKPTRYQIYTNSTGLEKFVSSGSMNAHLKGSLVMDNIQIIISGSGNITADQIECTSFESKTSGSGDLNLSGITQGLRCSISGSGKVKAQSMTANRVYCNVSGSGNFEVHAVDYLKVSISGSGEVKYKGNPEIDPSISGSGKVNRLN